MDGCEIYVFEDLDIIKRVDLIVFKAIRNFRGIAPTIFSYGETGHYL